MNYKKLRKLFKTKSPFIGRFLKKYKIKTKSKSQYEN